MKRAIIIILGMAAANLGGSLRSQTPPAPSAPAPAPAITKVGVVNMLQLYTKCNKVAGLKTRNEEEVKPYKAKREELENLVEQWQKAFKVTKPGAELTQQQKEQGAKIIRECNRQLQDLEMKFMKEVVKRNEDDLAALSKYIDEMIKYYSRQQGYHLVLAYGEPETPLPSMVAIQRYMSSMDRGHIRPIFIYPGSVDITQEVVNLINSAH